MKLKLLAAGAALAFAASAWAAESLPPQGTTPETRLYGAPGQPNISGIWFPDMGKTNQVPGRGRGFGSHAPIWGMTEPPLKGKYLTEFKQNEADADAGHPLADTASECKALGEPRILSGPDPMEIIQTPGQITLIQETGPEIRRIYTDGRKEPDDPDPWFDGHNIGHWEGNTLVVHAMGLRPETALDAAETPHSDALTVDERWTLVDPNHLVIDATATDPKAFTHPWKGRFYWARGDADYEMIEDICADNNRNTTNANGTQSTELGQ